MEKDLGAVEPLHSVPIHAQEFNRKIRNSEFSTDATWVRPLEFIEPGSISTSLSNLMSTPPFLLSLVIPAKAGIQGGAGRETLDRNGRDDGVGSEVWSTSRLVP